MVIQFDRTVLPGVVIFRRGLSRFQLLIQFGRTVLPGVVIFGRGLSRFQLDGTWFDQIVVSEVWFPSGKWRRR